MGCVSSDLFHQTPNDFSNLHSSAAFSHHIVSLTSSTYGLLSLDDPPPRFTFGSIFPTPLLSDNPKPDPEVINSWELMAGLTDAESFRFPTPPPKSETPIISANKICNPKNNSCICTDKCLICPPGGEDKVVLYTTSLRGVRKTFEECNAVRKAVESLGVVICERDVSMDRGFREELKELMKGAAAVPPRLFVRGRCVGGYDEVMRIVEEGLMGEVVEGLRKKKAGEVCEGCGAARFLPCFRCNGSAKIVVKVAKEGRRGGGRDVVRCPECNENGLVLCPICS